MAQTFGALLGQMRQSTGWSLGQLAQKAAVSKSALSRWESSRCQPRMTELLAVLDALGATPAQRALACARLDAPRALRQLRHLSAPDAHQPHTSGNGFGPPLAAGDLLRALRLRQGATQEQVAARLGVTRSTLARWELGERLPDTEQMQTLCYTLAAREEELIALTSGYFCEPPSAEPMTWEEKEPDLLRRVESFFGPYHDDFTDLVELRFIALDRELWHWALHEPNARLILARVRAYHAHHHRLRRHWNVSRNLAKSVQNTLQGAVPATTRVQQEAAEQDFLRASIAEAAAVVHGGGRPAPERGIRLLAPLLERRLSLPVYTAWILSEMAAYSVLKGDTEEALMLSERALWTAEQSNDRLEVFLRQCDKGRILLGAGRGNDALHVLPDLQEWNLSDGGYERAHALLLHAEARYQVGSVSEARQWLEKAEAVIADQNLEQRKRAQSLAQKL